MSLAGSKRLEMQRWGGTTPLMVGSPSAIERLRWQPDRAVADVAPQVVTGLQQHWLLLVNMLLGMFVAGALLTPLLFAGGFSAVRADVRGVSPRLRAGSVA